MERAVTLANRSTCGSSSSSSSRHWPPFGRPRVVFDLTLHSNLAVAPVFNVLHPPDDKTKRSSSVQEMQGQLGQGGMGVSGGEWDGMGGHGHSQNMNMSYHSPGHHGRPPTDGRGHDVGQRVAAGAGGGSGSRDPEAEIKAGWLFKKAESSWGWRKRWYDSRTWVCGVSASRWA